jgi:RNase P subunit RPR2
MIDQVRIDDQKFQEKIQRKLFFDRIVREANEALLCPGCYTANWRMHRKFWIRIVENSLIATMICRKCGRKLPFATQIEPDEDEEEEEEPAYYPFGIGRPHRRRRGLDIDQRIRLLHFL